LGFFVDVWDDRTMKYIRDKVPEMPLFVSAFPAHSEVTYVADPRCQGSCRDCPFDLGGAESTTT
jgi:hypothetical protein